MDNEAFEIAVTLGLSLIILVVIYLLARIYQLHAILRSMFPNLREDAQEFGNRTQRECLTTDGSRRLVSTSPSTPDSHPRRLVQRSSKSTCHAEEVRRSLSGLPFAENAGQMPSNIRSKVAPGKEKEPDDPKLRTPELIH